MFPSFGIAQVLLVPVHCTTVVGLRVQIARAVGRALFRMASSHTPLLADPGPRSRWLRPNPDTFAFAVAMVALQAQWAVVYIYLVPQLLELHVPPSLASDAWLLSPLLQLVLSPLAGRLSDRLSGTHGRRRPFLVATTAISTVLLLCVPFLPHLCARTRARARPRSGPGFPPRSRSASRVAQEGRGGSPWSPY